MSDTEDVFSFLASRSGDVFISHFGEQVSTLRKYAAAKFLRRVEKASPAQAQQMMARATGNYKRGNERDGKTKATR